MRFKKLTPEFRHETLVRPRSPRLPGNTLAIKCQNGRDFSTVTFDAVNFTPGVPYHDMANGMALYETAVLNSWWSELATPM
ncbi:hypothetical protein RRG08_067315 [Elysia crispata]|uniref:Uncharacterized protein n=1 Tax=Elysia crispata TaxID=231223 RepID=A0AAE1DZG5_9GAST|nr:hypothetical protein RRG08_067315 [Elysia crispata]